MSELTSSKRGETSGRPKRFWQSLILYPSLAIAVLTAVPEWLNAGAALWKGVKPSQMASVNTQQKFWERNMKCTQSVFEWVENPQNVKVDGTICPSGDIMVRIEVPNQNGHYRGSIRGILIDDIVRQTQISSLSPLPALPSLVGTAHAAVSPTHPLPKPSIRTLANRVLAQNSQFAVVVCQKFMSDKRTMKRHVKVSGQCYDEFVDTFTGNIKRRQKTSCKRGCG